MKMVPLGDILQEYKLNPLQNEDLPVLTLTEKNGFVYQKDRFNKRLATEDTSTYKVVRPMSLAFNPYLLWAGALAQNTGDESGIISPLYPTFNVKNTYDPAYIYRLLLTPEMIQRYDSIAYGSVPRRRRSSVKDFLSLQIPTPPPLDEQRRIAAILDKADAIRQKRRQVIVHLDSLAQSIFQRMFGSSSKRAKLGAIFEVSTGSTPSRANPANFGGGIPWVKTGEVDGTITTTEETVSRAGVRSSRLTLFPPKSIIIAMYGQGKTRGQSAILGLHATTNQACAVLPPNDNYYPEFIQTQLRSGYERLRGAARGGNQANLNLQIIRDFEVTVAPLELQAQFAAVLSEINRSKSRAKTALDKSRALFESLQSRAFRGEL